MNVKKVMNKSITLYGPIILMILWTIFPIYWTLNTAFKDNASIMKKPVEYVPLNPTINNFVVTWNSVGFGTFFKNSVIVGIFTVIIVLIVSLLAGYSLSRYKFKGKGAFLLTLLCTQFIPRSMLIIPMFIIFDKLHLINSPWSLILTYTAAEIPFTAILLSGFFSNIPKELEEAASVDGANRFQTIRYVLVPLLLPGIVATGIFTFIYTWNEFIIALMLNTDQSKFTLPVGLSFMIGENTVNYGALAAGGVIVLIPSIVLFAFAQKHFVHGIGGAVKG